MFQGRYGVLGNDFFSDYLRPELLNYLVIVFYFIYLYADYLALCGVLLNVSNVKKTAYRPPVALCTFLRAVKSRFLSNRPEAGPNNYVRVAIKARPARS
jgi:hypothetical protein